MGEVSSIRSLASKENVGCLYFVTRLFLYEACIVPCMLYLLEAWVVMEKELEKLENLQRKILCSLMEVPKTTPYWGLLHETGQWSIKWRLVYRKLMLYHNIMTSEDDRLVKGVIEQQKGKKGSFYEDVQVLGEELNLKDIHEMEKAELKTAIKNEVKKRMKKEIEVAAEGSTKLRFIRTTEFQQASYFQHYGSEDAKLILKMRLNMVDVYGNFKGDITKKRLCSHCKEHLDTTEHLVQCRKVSGAVVGGESVLRDPDSKEWKELLKVVRTNLGSR